MEVAQPAGVEPCLAGAAGLDRRADPLERRQQAIPLVRYPGRVGRHEPQRRAAGERLPQPDSGAHAERLGGRRGLADELLAPGFGGERNGARGQRLTAPGGDGELEARDEDADDQGERMFASIQG